VWATDRWAVLYVRLLSWQYMGSRVLRQLIRVPWERFEVELGLRSAVKVWGVGSGLLTHGKTREIRGGRGFYFPVTG
jgi:hypothetical protein